jgi:hypothetical protein
MFANRVVPMLTGIRIQNENCGLTACSAHSSR